MAKITTWAVEKIQDFAGLLFAIGVLFLATIDPQDWD